MPEAAPSALAAAKAPMPSPGPPSPTLRQRFDSFQRYLDDRPRLYVAYIVSIYCPLLIAVFVLREAPTLFLARASFFLLVVYTAIRDSLAWLSNLFTFFWYVQMNLIAKLRGEGALEQAGQFVHWGTVAGLCCGLLVMVIAFPLGRPLLAFTSSTDPDAVVALGLDAWYAAVFSLPAVVMQAPVTGAMLGMHEFVRTAGTVCAWGAVGAAIVVALLFTQVDFAATPPAEPEPTYVRDGSRDFIVSSAVATSVVFWGLAVSITVLQYWLGRVQGMYPRGLPRCAGVDVGGSWAAVRSVWGRDTLGVAVRSILNNTRDIVSLVIALRIGVEAGAILALYGSISSVSYGVPNVLSTAAMATGSKHLGEARWSVLLWTLRFFHWFALGCGLLFALVLLTQRDAIVNLFSNNTEYPGFLELIDEVWPLFIVAQPVYALIAVLGPLLVTTQNYVYWGKVVALCFVAVYVPVTAVASARSSLLLVMLGDLLYNVAHVALLVWKVTHLEMGEIAKKARADAALAGPDS